MDTHNSPIIVKPLTLRGVFGITNSVMKRRFWSVTAYVLIYMAIASLLLLLCLAPCLPIIINPDPSPGAIAGCVVLSVVFALLASLGIWLALTPMYAGTLYSELSARIYGGGSTLKQLLKRSRYSLKRFFTLNLCHGVAMWVVQLIVSLITSILSTILMMGGMLSLIFTALPAGLSESMDPGMTFEYYLEGLTPGMAAGIIVPMVVVMLAAIIISLCASVPLLFTYPVAVNEKAKNFSAVGRSIKLGFKRFGRILAATMLFSLIMLGAWLVFAGLMVLFAFIGTYAVVPAMILETLLILCYILFTCAAMAYSAALSTVLYFDARVRIEGEGAMGYTHGNESAHAQPEYVYHPQGDEQDDAPQS